MKDLEALKKRLPPGIDIRITSKNVIKFRARFRRKGHKDVFTTKSDLKSAKQWLAERERSAFLGELHPTAMIGNKHIFSDGIKRYYREELPKKGNDAKNREHHLNWFEKHLGKIKFSSIRSSDIKDAVLILENEKKPNGKPLAPATIIRYLASLSHLFSIAWKEWEWISENPVKKISKPSLSNSRQRYLSHNEKERLLAEVKKSKCPILLPVVVLALSTGMRANEIMKLRCKDIAFDQGYIFLRSSKNGEPRFIIADADVIIVDNLSCWMTSGVENEGESWIPVQDWALRQRRKGKAVVFIHHANKNNRQRGTSRREDILDYVIKLDKPSDYKPKDGANFVLSFEKHRSWFGTDVESLQVKLIDKADGKRVWEWSAIEEKFVDNEKLEIESLYRQGKKQNEIAKALNISPATVSRKLKNCVIS